MREDSVPRELRRFRLFHLMLMVAACAFVCGLGVTLYRTWHPIHHWIQETRSGGSQFVRLQALQNLESLPPREREAAIPALLDATRDPDALVRVMAASVLGSIGGRRDKAVSVYHDLMSDPEARIRTAAIFGLETLVKPGTVEAAALELDLIAALDDPSPSVRLEACRALYRLGSRRQSLPALARLVREELGVNRVAALAFLLKMGKIPKDLEPTLRTMGASQYAPERTFARLAMMQLGIPEPEYHALLRTMLESSAASVRLAAAETLIRIGRPGDATPVLKVIATGDDRATRARAERLLHEAEIQAGDR